MEPRTFKQEPPVGEFLRINPKGKTDRQLLVAALKQAEATHGCLEKHIAETRLSYLDATEKRQALTDVVQGLRDDVSGVQLTQQEQAAQVRVLTLALGVEQPNAGETKPRAHVEIPWKAVFKIASAVGGTLGLIIFLYQLARAIWPVVDAYLMSLSPT